VRGGRKEGTNTGNPLQERGGRAAKRREAPRRNQPNTGKRNPTPSRSHILRPTFVGVGGQKNGKREHCCATPIGGKKRKVGGDVKKIRRKPKTNLSQKRMKAEGEHRVKDLNFFFWGRPNRKGHIGKGAGKKKK